MSRAPMTAAVGCTLTQPSPLLRRASLKGRGGNVGAVREPPLQQTGPMRWGPYRTAGEAGDTGEAPVPQSLDGANKPARPGNRRTPRSTQVADPSGLGRSGRSLRYRRRRAWGSPPYSTPPHPRQGGGSM